MTNTKKIQTYLTNLYKNSSLLTLIPISTGDDEKENVMPSYKFSKAKFESTKWAECIITEADNDKLTINEAAMSAIRKHFRDVISLVGPPGVGMFACLITTT